MFNQWHIAMPCIHRRQLGIISGGSQCCTWQMASDNYMYLLLYFMLSQPTTTTRQLATSLRQLLDGTRVKYWSSDTRHIRTLYLGAGTSDKGRDYTKWCLGVTSLHISSESPCKYFNAASGRREKWFRKQLCSDVCIHFRPVHANAAMHNPISSRLEIVVAPPIS